MAKDYTNLPTTREEARRAGIKRYFTGEPCKHGHIKPRNTINGQCVGCSSAVTTRRAKEKRYGPDREAVLADIKAKRDEWKKKPGVMERLRQQAQVGMLKYREKNPHHARVMQSNQRARKLGSEATLTSAEFDAILASQNGLCAECGKPHGDDYHLDHKVPIRLFGPSTKENVQVACAPCNRTKRAMGPNDWQEYKARILALK